MNKTDPVFAINIHLNKGGIVIHIYIFSLFTYDLNTLHSE